MQKSEEIKIQGSIMQNALKYAEPRAPERPKTFLQHGEQRNDSYYWLNERDNPEVKSYLEQENDYLEKVMEPVKELRKTLYEEMIARIKQDDNTVPYEKNGYSYYTRYETGKEYPIYCRKKLNDNANEEIIVNVNELAEGKKFCNVIAPTVSPDNQLAVYGLDTTGRNLHEAFVKNLETGDIIEKNSPVIAGDFVWTSDSKAFFYDTKDLTTLRTDKVWLHKLGQPFEKDQLIYHETDETTYASLASSKDEKFLFINCGYTENVECHFISLHTYTDRPLLVKKRSDDFYYALEHFENRFLILTNDNAENFRIMQTEDTDYSYESWKELIPHQADVLIEELEVFSNWLVLRERKNGLNQLHILPWKKLNEGHYIQFRDDSYDCWLGANYQMGTDTLRVIYTSFTTPISSYDYHMENKSLALLKENPVLGDFKKENYKSEYIQVKSRDGVDIPVSLVYRKGFVKNGKAPALLYGYGSYGINMDATFSSNLISLLDRGFIYAIAHIRGGKEKGWSWYEEGKLMKKMNTFYDFIDCAEYLVNNNYTSPSKLFGRGGSAGGLLMGVVYNLRPDLFRGILAHVPFVDVITTMSDPAIPLTAGEYNEWGNPEIKEEYTYMKQYSPVDNIIAKKYTNLLVTTGYSDSQVQYWEPAKWVAKLRKLRIDKTDLILFHTNLDAGHGGASGRFERLKEIALDYAFMLGLLADSENSQ